MYLALRYLYYQMVIRFSDKRQFIRFNYFRRLGNMSEYLKKNNMVGGLMEKNGDYYLKTPDNLFVYYNYHDYSITLGDGQSLEFQCISAPSFIEEFILQNLSECGVYIDVGSNNGYHYAMKVARKYPGVSIYCIEPDASILPHLRKNIAINRFQNIRVFQLALSDRKGTVEMTKNLGASGYLITDGKAMHESVLVNVDTLDNFIESNKIPGIDLIKVDIEGGELNFIKGGEKTLKNIRPIILMELNEKLLNRSGATIDAVVTHMKSCSYICFRIIDTNDALALPKEKLKSICSFHMSRIAEIV